MLNSGAMPFLIELKISPSVDPCFQFLSVRSGASGVRSLPGLAFGVQAVAVRAVPVERLLARGDRLR